MSKELEKQKLEGCGRGLTYGRPTILDFAWRDRVKPRKASVMIVGVPAEIRTEHLSNTIQKCYPFSQRIYSLLLKTKQ
jgi:hypothetical protein